LSQQDLSEQNEGHYSAVANQLVGRYGWQLLAPEELVQRALGQIQAGAADRFASAAVGAYCVALHAACSGGEGPARQNQAYGELARYLHSLACMRFADLPPEAREDVTQSALERIFKSFGRCREPVAFLAFASQHMLDAARITRRQTYQASQSLEQALGEAGDAVEDTMYDKRPQPVEQIIADERRAAIEQLLQEFQRAHPRAAQQIAVLRLSWLDELDDEEIGRRLGISLSSVYTARSRIRKTIQSEPAWEARAVELGILSDEV
jgi:RNA polymerase sigma factor (sigma-70 family)